MTTGHSSAGIITLKSCFGKEGVLRANHSQVQGLMNKWARFEKYEGEIATEIYRYHLEKSTIPLPSSLLFATIFRPFRTKDFLEC
jgi:hypothetical protein